MAKHPDPKWHLRISLAKSVLRIVAGMFLVIGNFIAAGTLIVASELLGIVEELV
jgi:hypothetical protein